MGQAKFKKMAGMYPQVVTKPHKDGRGRTVTMIPPELLELQQLMALPENADLTTEGMKGKTFEEALGNIAAVLDIALDGDYLIPDLCKFICVQIKTQNGKRGKGLAVAGTVPVELVEEADRLSMELDIARLEKTQLNQTQRNVVANNIFMRERGCKICDHIHLCVTSGKCLGNSDEVMDAAIAQRNAEEGGTRH